jgi:hypothetical protein
MGFHRLTNGSWADFDRDAIYNDICLLNKTATEFAQKLEGGSDREIGIGLLHAWMKDLLGILFVELH